MAILSGKRLGPYEILSAIGAGGMGEVYRARDTRLERIVAVKILPDHLSDRAELRERFEREARTIASLNHPHICTLYDIGLQDGTNFLVMEYLEGETLAERLKKGPLLLDQVLQYAIEIADALDKAHRKGITHRDLKPGNIMLTKSGTTLLDFGLAKLRGPQAAVANLSALPTEGSNLTSQGSIVGTLQYMAPEQLEGKEVDARTDIFSFGTVVYEMATGKKAFEGKTSASVMAKILETDPPPISSLQPMTPPQLDRVVKKCLAKEPEGRWQAASDLTDALKWIAEGGSQVTLAPAATAPAQGSRRPIGLGLAALGILAIGSIATWYLKPSLPRPPSPAHLVVALPPGDRLAPLNIPVEISPDGTQLAYVATRNGVDQLFLRALDDTEAKPIPGTEGAFNPFFSPDGQWIGFFAQGKMKKVSIHGGVPVTLCDAGLSGGASWGVDDSIVFAPTRDSGLWQVSATGGKAQILTTPDPAKGEFNRYPQILPSGKGVLFTATNGAGWDESRIELLRLDTKERIVLVRGGNTGRYVPSGHLIYYRAGSLLAVPFDLARLEVKGTSPITVADGVRKAFGAGGADYSVSTAGTLAYISASPHQFESRLVWEDRQGGGKPTPAPPRAYSGLTLSRDGKQAAVTITSDTQRVWTYDLARGTLTQLTSEQGSRRDPVWTPDGKRLAYRSNKAGGWSLFWRPSDGSGSEERLTTSDKQQIPESFSPDGQLLAIEETHSTTANDIWVLHLSDYKEQPFLQTPADEYAPQFSPDGRWLAYISDESGGAEVYVQPYPGPGRKWRISSGGGAGPRWNPNGRELFYQNGDKMMAVDVTTSPSFSVGTPKMLFVVEAEDIADWDVSPDGQRFLMIKPVEQQQAATQINVVLNWFEELKQKVPPGKK
jgi:Tol biopolymer transport system component/predicted Ser/Thr protein kinase